MVKIKNASHYDYGSAYFKIMLRDKLLKNSFLLIIYPLEAVVLKWLIHGYNAYCLHLETLTLMTYKTSAETTLVYFQIYSRQQ